MRREIITIILICATIIDLWGIIHFYNLWKISKLRGLFCAWLGLLLLLTQWPVILRNYLIENRLFELSKIGTLILIIAWLIFHYGVILISTKENKMYREFITKRRENKLIDFARAAYDNQNKEFIDSASTRNLNIITSIFIILWGCFYLLTKTHERQLLAMMYLGLGVIFLIFSLKYTK